MPKPAVSEDAVLEEVSRILASQAFQGAGRSGALLRFVVERTLSGKADELKEYTLGAEALGRGPDFDPRNDSIARVEASRLRSRLELYYSSEGRDNRLRILLPKGTYVPQFETRSIEAASQPWKWKIATAVASFVAVLAIWSPWRRGAQDQPAILRLEIDLGTDVALRSTQVGSSSVILSPDGRKLAFVSFHKQVPRLLVTTLERQAHTQPKQLDGTEGARGPFFSPDGRWLGYWASGKLWKVAADGGTPVVLCEAQDLLGASWADDNTIVAAITTSGLYRLPANGVKPERLEGISDDLGARWPQVLPGAKAVLFSAGAPAQGPPRILAYSFADRKVKDLGIGGGHARYLRSGHLLWVDRGNLLTAPFDAAGIRLTAKPVVFAQDVATGMYGSAEFDAAGTGALVYRRRPGGSKSRVLLLDASGKATALVDEPGEYAWPRLSPDGRRLSFLAGQIEQRDAVELRIVDVASKRTLKSAVGVMYSSPVWSPDGRFIVYPRPGGGLNYTSVEGNSGPELLMAANGLQIPWSFARQGGRLAYYQRGIRQAPVTFDLWTVPTRVDGDRLLAGKPEPFVVSDGFELFPAFSPDGHWVAYTSLESGAYEISVRAFPDSSRQWRISTDGGIVATWAPDKRQLFYQGVNGQIMVLDWSVRGGDFVAGVPRRWGTPSVVETGITPAIDAGPQGRIAALVPVSTEGRQDEHHVTLVVNGLIKTALAVSTESR